MKHFEDLWLEAEELLSDVVGTENDFDKKAYLLEESAGQLVYYILEDDSSESADYRKELVGELLFNLALICKKFDINSWQELEKAINNVKIDLNNED